MTPYKRENNEKINLYSTDNGDLVRLKDFGNKPMIIGLIPGNETKGYLIPNNTQAVVLEWYRDYTIKDIPSRHKDMILMVNHIYVFLE